MIRWLMDLGFKPNKVICWFLFFKSWGHTEELIFTIIQQVIHHFLLTTETSVVQQGTVPIISAVHIDFFCLDKEPDEKRK